MEVSKSDSPDFNKLCCILSEQVHCIENLCDGDVADALQNVLKPAKGQLSQMCGSYKYTPGCSEEGGKAEPEGEGESESEPEGKSDESSAFNSVVPSFILMVLTAALLRFNH